MQDLRRKHGTMYDTLPIPPSIVRNELKCALEDIKTWKAFVLKHGGYEPHAFDECTDAIVEIVVVENYARIVA